VGLEALVFNGNNRLAQDGGKAVVADDLAALEGKRADDAALLVVELGGGGRTVVFEVVDLRQIEGIDQGQAGHGAGDDGQGQQRDQGELANKFAAPFGRNGLHLQATGAGQRVRLKLRGAHRLKARL